MLSLVEDAKEEGYHGVHIDEDVYDYMGGPVNWFNPAERCDIIPVLQQLGYSVVRFDDEAVLDGDDCCLLVKWTTPTEEELSDWEANGWTHFAPQS